MAAPELLLNMPSVALCPFRFTHGANGGRYNIDTVFVVIGSSTTMSSSRVRHYDGKNTGAQLSYAKALIVTSSGTALIIFPRVTLGRLSSCFHRRHLNFPGVW